MGVSKENQRKFAKFQREMRANPTPAEAAVKAALDELGITYVFQKGFLRDNTIRLVDFYIVRCQFGRQICLEVDGKYHEKQEKYDRYREGRIAQQRAAIKFARITNEWVFGQKDLASSLTVILSSCIVAR